MTITVNKTTKQEDGLYCLIVKYILRSQLFRNTVANKHNRDCWLEPWCWNWGQWPLTFSLSKPVRQLAVFWLALSLISWPLQVSSIHLQHSQMVSACVWPAGKVHHFSWLWDYLLTPYASCVRGPLIYFEIIYICKWYLMYFSMCLCCY